MCDPATKLVRFNRRATALLAVLFLTTSPIAIRAQQAASDKVSNSSNGQASPKALLLRTRLKNSLGGGEPKEFSPENLADLAGDDTEVYREYGVTSAASAEHRGLRVDLFQTRNRFGAFGLFSFFAGAAKGQPSARELGPGTARINGELLFWKGNYFARILDSPKKRSRSGPASQDELAGAIASEINAPGIAHPPLLDGLPAGSMIAGSERYFLGPQSLGARVKGGRDMIKFEGETEAVIAEYRRAAGDDSSGVLGSDAPLELLIVECHTPRFATDAMAQAEGFVASLPQTEQQQIILKRTGNYIVGALNVGDREFAGSLVDSIEYPYTVKWLRNPLWPTNDPFRTQKAAEMLLSTFGLLGLILITVVLGGTVFGTTIFLKRRKQQRQVFSDAGGMLRLDLDPFEPAILGLPAKRSEE